MGEIERDFSFVYKDYDGNKVELLPKTVGSQVLLSNGYTAKDHVNDDRHLLESEKERLVKTNLPSGYVTLGKDGYIPTEFIDKSFTSIRQEYNTIADMLADSKKAWELALENVGGDVDKLIYNFSDFSYDESKPVDPEEGCDKEYWMDFLGPDNDFDQTVNRENLLYRIAPYGSSNSRFYPSEDWKSIFDKEHDLRWKLFALKAPGYSGNKSGVSFNDGPRVIYTRADNLSNTQAYTHPLLLLMKAEAEARTGDYTAALADLNILRKYRYTGDGIELSGLTGDALLEEILKERRREQPLVSIQRTIDLKRYALDAGKPWSKQTIEHQCGNKTYTKSITDAYFQSLPIDNAILEYNPQWGIGINTDNYEPYNAD